MIPAAWLHPSIPAALFCLSHFLKACLMRDWAKGRIVSQGWQIKQINITGGTLGSVHVNVFEEALDELGVKKKAWTTIRKAHVRRLLGC
jgi:hypothetical protein